MKSEMTFEEMEFKLREEFLSLIGERVETNRFIRIWEKEEREKLTEEEISNIYATAPRYFSITVEISYEKKTNKEFFTFEVAKGDISEKSNHYKAILSAHSFLGISSETYLAFTTWAKNAATLIKDKLFEESRYYLRKVCFDVIDDRDKKAQFLLLNLPLSNVKFSRKPRNSKMVTLTSYVQDNLDDFQSFLNSDYVRWMEKHNNK